MTIEVGGATETVNVAAEAAIVQSQSGEPLFTVDTELVQNLPINRGNFANLAASAPGTISGGGRRGPPAWAASARTTS